MDRREKLLTALCGKDLDGNSVKYADATIKLILGDMGKEYIKFWEIEDAESSNNEDLSESFRRILESVQKIDPTAGAGYILNDHQGMRYFYIDYNKESE